MVMKNIFGALVSIYFLIFLICHSLKINVQDLPSFSYAPDIIRTAAISIHVL